MVELHLADVNPALIASWEEFFRAFPEVVIHPGDLLAVAENAVVSPAHSLGFMDGGIDRVYRDYFGPVLERKVQQAIARRPEGHLLVGASLVVRTGHARIPFLIVAPTMFLPERVEDDHCYRALRAVLRLAGRYPEVGRKVFCPGLATGVGGVPPQSAARAMAQAYQDWKEASQV